MRRRRVRARIVREVRMIANRFGVDVVALRPERHLSTRRLVAFRDGSVNLVLDVGANVGQYAERLRTHGYRGRIVSFEPLQDAFERLSGSAAADALWDCRCVALGDSDGEAAVNVSANSWSSSLLPMLPAHEIAAPDSRYVATEFAPLARLDSIRGDVVRADDRVHLKIDVQGMELAVLRGAEETLEQVVSAECELSLIPLYDGQPLIEDVVSHLEDRGLVPVAVEPAYATASGHVIQLDALFARLA
jgi:FkbM family methyltransferase